GVGAPRTVSIDASATGSAYDEPSRTLTVTTGELPAHAQTVISAGSPGATLRVRLRSPRRDRIVRVYAYVATRRVRGRPAYRRVRRVRGRRVRRVTLRSPPSAPFTPQLR